MRTLRMAGVALNQTPIDWENNLKNIRSAIAQAKKESADLICFSELAITGYGCEDLFLSDWLCDQAWTKLEELLKETDGIMVGLGLPIRMDGTTYNGVAVAFDQKIIGVALKQNLPGDGIHYEPRWFAPWRAGEVLQLQKSIGTIPVGDLLFDCKGILFGFEICEDAWRKQRPAETLCRKGAELILNPSASHFVFGKSLVREKIVTESSKQFDCVFMMVNQLGNEAGKVIYDGDILVASKGNLICRAPRLSFHPYSIQVLEVDFDEVMALKPEPEVYDTANEEFAQAASLALFDYLRKSKASGYTLSLSGGADSSTCAILIAEMVSRASDELGWKNFWYALGHPEAISANEREAVSKVLFTAYQSTSNSSEETLNSARTLAESIGANFYQWSVDQQVTEYREKIETVLGRALDWSTDDVALQNIQARSRSPIIWMLANITKSILITTSNRSEGDVGYATMDGDTSGSLAPVAGVSKPFILNWLKWAEQDLGYSGLSEVNRLQPTAELRPPDRTQTDEKDLMPYNLLLDIERLAIGSRQSPISVYLNLKEQYTDREILKKSIARFFRLWSINQWKRERLAPSFHFDDWNVDPRSWCRFPILSGGFKEEIELMEKAD